MAATVPRAEQIDAGGTTNADYIDGVHDWIALAPGNFTISNVVGSPVTSFTLTHTDLWQLNYELDAGVIYGVIAPDGGIVDSTDPTAAANTSPRDVLCPSPAGTSQLMSCILYDDAMFFGVHDSGDTHYEYAWHHGKILSPDLPSDAALGVDGLGVLAYLLDETLAFTAYSWWCSNSTAGNRKSYIRVGINEWSSPGTDRSISSQSAGPNSRKMATIGAISAAPGSAPSATSSPHIGRYKYVMVDIQGTLSPYSIRPSSATLQGWLSSRNSTSVTRLRMLWDRTETP